MYGQSANHEMLKSNFLLFQGNGLVENVPSLAFKITGSFVLGLFPVGQYEKPNLQVFIKTDIDVIT